MSITDLVPVETRSGVDSYRQSTDAATLCGEIVKQTASTIQGRKYVACTGWQAIAIAHGCTASACNVERVEGGYRATGQVRRMDNGSIIAEAEGFVGEDEPTWFGGKAASGKVLPKRADFAIRAMAQTRAISRACRSAFAHVVVLIDKNLGTTPAEEIQGAYDHDPNSMMRVPGGTAPSEFADEAVRDGLAKDTTSTYQVEKDKKLALLRDSALLAIGTSENRPQLSVWWSENRDTLKKKLGDDDYVTVYDAVLAKRDALPELAA